MRTPPPGNAGALARNAAFSSGVVKIAKDQIRRAFGRKRRVRAGEGACVPGVVCTLFIGPVVLLAILSIGAQTATDTNWPQTLQRLTQLLSGDSEQKRTALAEIRNLRTEQASRIGVQSLRDKDEIVRATAASSVVFLPKDEAAAALLPLLDDKKPFVRREAAYALGRVRSSSAVQRLAVTMTRDRDLEVRSAAAVALGGIGDQRALDALLQVLRKKPDEDEEFLRRSAARSIGQIFDVLHGGDTYTLTPQNFLSPKFKDIETAKPDPPLPANTNMVIAELSRILQNPKEADDTRREAAYALGAVRQPSSTTLLQMYLNGSDPYLAEISEEALLKIEKQQQIRP